jgi:uncharacterized protein YprB with RNaseH-like and TPR domain
MKLTKPIVFFDLETTGIEISTARIVLNCALIIMNEQNKMPKQ